MMLEKDFMNILEQEIRDNPNYLGSLFKFACSKWGQLEELQRLRRDSAHRKALEDMLLNTWAIALYKKRNPKLFSNAECCTLLDAVDAVLPSGKGGSDAHKQLLKHFADSMRALGWKPEDSFIKNIREKSELLTNIYKEYPA